MTVSIGPNQRGGPNQHAHSAGRPAMRPGFDRWPRPTCRCVHVALTSASMWWSRTSGPVARFLPISRGRTERVLYAGQRLGDGGIAGLRSGAWVGRR